MSWFKKSSGLIDTSWLEEKGVDTIYQDAFNRTKKNLKSEIARNEGLLRKAEEAIEVNKAKRNDLEMQKIENNTAINALKKEDGWQGNPEIQRLDALLDLIHNTIDDLNEDDLEEHGKLRNLSNTIEILQKVQSKDILTPKEMVEVVKLPEGGKVAGFGPTMGSRHDLDLSHLAPKDESD